MKISTLEILLTTLLLMIMSCQSSKPDRKVIVQERKMTPIQRLSVDLSNTLGFDLAQVDSQLRVKSIKPHSPSYVAGLRENMVVKKLGDIGIAKLDDDGIKEILRDIFDGTLAAQIVQPDGTESELNIHFGVDNCPQKLQSYFWFVEEPKSGKPSTMLRILFFREIMSLTFEHKFGSRIELFNSIDNNWVEYDKRGLDFADDIDPSRLSDLLKNEYLYVSDSENKKGSIRFSGDFAFDLEFDTTQVRIDPDMVLTGKGRLKIGGSEFDGFVMSRHVITRHIVPFSKKSDLNIWRSIPPNTRHLEERLLDWIVLFDSSGNALEMSIDGQSRNWWGILYPSQDFTEGETSCLASLPKTELDGFEMSWFDNVVAGLEADPYPFEIMLTLTDLPKCELSLKSFAPYYQSDNMIISVALAGTCKTPDGNPILVAGYMNRMTMPSN